jgi:hypothetical protein
VTKVASSRAARAPWALLFVAVGCGPTSESSSLDFPVDGAGAVVGLHGSTSASGAQVELEWTMVVDNLGAQPCTVAVYRWLEGGLDPELPLPTTSAEQDWPASWADGELLEAGTVEPGAELTLGPALLADPAEVVEGQLGLAACPGAQLELGVRAELDAGLGVRAILDAVLLELWRMR